jgi:WD40 repeat protein
VFTRQPKLETYSWSQVINTTHPVVTTMKGVTSRVATCSLNDSAINIYFYNLTTQQFTLSQTITDSMNGKCSSLEMSTWEERIVIGRSTGDIYTYYSDYNRFYTKEYTMLGAHSASVRFVKLTFDNSNLLSGSEDGNISLWTKANNFTNATTQRLNAIAAEWNYYSGDYTVIDNNSNIKVFRLLASNCTYQASSKYPSPSRCNCPAGQVWLHGNCTVLNCSNIVNS